MALRRMNPGFDGGAAQPRTLLLAAIVGTLSLGVAMLALVDSTVTNRAGATLSTPSSPSSASSHSAAPSRSSGSAGRGSTTTTESGRAPGPLASSPTQAGPAVGNGTATTPTPTAAASTAATPASAVAVPACAGAPCLAVNADQTLGTMNHRANGILDNERLGGLSPLRQLAPSNWRVGVSFGTNGLPDFSVFDAARQAGVPAITILISNAWFWATSGGCGVPTPNCGATTPWSNLATYSAWVQHYVQVIEASGRRPAYWEIQNEPDAASVAGAYYNYWGASTVTVANVLAQFQVAYNAIKAADANAQIIGPSLAQFRADSVGHLVGIRDFLTFSTANNLRWAALEWHELTPSPAGTQPAQTITADVATARRLLAAFPAIGSIPIGITEYGQPANRLLPGWIVGDVAALENAGVGWAGMTCWPTATVINGGGSCTSTPSTLDELLLADGSRTAAYWTYVAYASMTGQRIPATSPFQTVSVLGSIAPGNVVQLLIGRHVTCTAPVNADCADGQAVPAPSNMPVSISVPWSGSSRVTVQRIANARGPVAGIPAGQVQGAESVNGLIQYTLGGLADGQAVLLTVTPA
jgi:hypothetical protein